MTSFLVYKMLKAKLEEVIKIMLFLLEKNLKNERKTFNISYK